MQNNIIKETLSMDMLRYIVGGSGKDGGGKPPPAPPAPPQPKVQPTGSLTCDTKSCTAQVGFRIKF